MIPDAAAAQLIAFVVLAPGTTPEAASERLRRHCRESLTPVMCPATYHFEKTLPRTASGKKDRPRLAASLGTVDA